MNSILCVYCVPNIVSCSIIYIRVLQSIEGSGTNQRDPLPSSEANNIEFLFFADVDHRAVISRAGASDSSATPVAKTPPLLIELLHRRRRIVFFSQGSESTLFADFSPVSPFFLFLFFGYRIEFLRSHAFNFDQRFQRSRLVSRPVVRSLRLQM